MKITSLSNIIAYAAISMGAICTLSCNPEKGPEGTEGISMEPEFSITYEDAELTSMTFSRKEEFRIIGIESNAAWSAEISESGSGWLTVDPAEGKGNSSVAVEVSENTAEDTRTADLTFTVEGLDEPVTVTVSQSGNLVAGLKTGLILDVKFNADGTAEDISPLKNPIETIKGPELLTYYNSMSGNYVARFNHRAGQAVNTGYYKMDFTANQGHFKDKLADGHSIETVFMANTDLQTPDDVWEAKMISCHDAGGTGIIYSDDNIIFCINTTDNGYAKPYSGVYPEKGKYYHAVGVWDKVAGEAKIYIDGELKATVPATGEFVFPGAHKWFGIGADTGVNGENAWNGDVVVARVYDQALTDEDVRNLYNDARAEYPQNTVNIQDVQFMTGREVCAGAKYLILGSGYQEGDYVLIESSDNSSFSKECRAELVPEGIVIDLPEDIVSGIYNLLLERRGETYLLGTASLTVVNDPAEVPVPKVVAHRCFHKTAPENSMAALKAAQDLGAFGAEIDVWCTKDGKIVVGHDGQIGGVAFQEHNYNEIKDLTLANGEKVPTLEAMLDQIAASPGTKLIIEIKDHSSVDQENRAVDETVKLVKAKGLEGNVEYIAFDFNLCKRVLINDPDAIVAYLNGNKAPAELHDADLKGVDYSLDPYVRNPGWVAEAHDLGMLVNVWTLNDMPSFMTAINLKTDYISTDDPDVLMDLLDMLFTKK